MEEFASTSFRNNELRSSVCTFQGLSVSIVLLRCTVRMIHRIMSFCGDDDNSLESVDRYHLFRLRLNTCYIDNFRPFFVREYLSLIRESPCPTKFRSTLLFNALCGTEVPLIPEDKFKLCVHTD